MLILASASPRRQELLRNAGIAHLVRPANVLEEFLPGESPEACVERLARSKARASLTRDLFINPNTWSSAPDTVVAVDNELLGQAS